MVFKSIHISKLICKSMNFQIQKLIRNFFFPLKSKIFIVHLFCYTHCPIQNILCSHYRVYYIPCTTCKLSKLLHTTKAVKAVLQGTHNTSIHNSWFIIYCFTHMHTTTLHMLCLGTNFKLFLLRNERTFCFVSKRCNL